MMILEAALITASCVLFIQMGLSGEIQERVRIRFPLLSCPKCLSFWSVLIWMLCNGAGVIRAVATSFFCAYAALWAALVLDGLSVLYNWLYEQITENNDTTTVTEAGPDKDPPDDADEVPKL